MAQILIHFISCQRGACYNALYFNVIVPHLDSAEVLDNVLKGTVVRGKSGILAGKSGARIFPELLGRLEKVESQVIGAYLQENFRMGVG